MPWVKPSLTQLVQRVAADVAATLAIPAALVRRSVEDVLSRVLAGLAHGLYGFVEYEAKISTPWGAADEDHLNLDAWASWFGLTRNPGEFADGTLTVVAEAGAVVPSDARFIRSEGTTYVNTGGAVAFAGPGQTSASVNVVCETLGATGNAVAATPMRLVSPAAGVVRVVVASGAITGGVDRETSEQLFTRLKARASNPPQGGSASDYVAWALEVAGVTRAWCYPLKNASDVTTDGAVLVRFVVDGEVSPIPGAPKIAEVLAHLTEKKPATATLFVAPPTASAVAMTINLAPNTAETRAAVTAGVNDLFLRMSTPGGTIPHIKLLEAVITSAGVTNAAVPTPSGDITASTGQLKTVGTITYGSL